MTQDSYAAGPTEPPLPDTTIGADLSRTVAAHPDREALVEVASGRRWTWRELEDDVDRVARGLIGRRRRGRRPGRDLGAELRRVGAGPVRHRQGRRCVLVNINPAYRTPELAYALNQCGCR